MIITLLIPFAGIAQNTAREINGFNGIHFGTSKEKTTAAIKAKNGNILPDGAKLTGGEPAVIFSGVKLAGKKCDTAEVYFIKNRMYRAEFAFQLASDTLAHQYFNHVVKYFNALYGTGDQGPWMSNPSRKKHPPHGSQKQKGYAAWWEYYGRKVTVYIDYYFAVSVFFMDDNLWQKYAGDE